MTDRENTSAATKAATPTASQTQGTLDEAQGYRPNCPGKMICPITGELICVDRCPLGEEQGRVLETSTATC